MTEKNLPDYLINTKKDRATGIRLPSDLHAKIAQKADRNSRTFNSMIVALLYEALDQPEEKTLWLRAYRKILSIEERFNILLKHLNDHK